MKHSRPRTIRSLQYRLSWKHSISIIIKNILKTFGLLLETATGDVLWKEVIRKISQNLQENSCAEVSSLIKLPTWGLPEASNVIKKEAPTLVFSSKFCETIKTTFSTDHLRVTDLSIKIMFWYLKFQFNQ